MELKKVSKQTDAPDIPKGWDVQPLSLLCHSITDGTHFTPRYVEQGVPFYSVENVTANDFSNVKFITKEEHAILIKRCEPERGDILMTRIGSLGDTKLLDWEVNASIYVSLALLKPNERICPKYLYCYSKSPQFVADVESRALLNATPKKINMGDIGLIPIPFPRSTQEQEAIAKALSDADALIESLEQLVAKKRQIKQGAMQELLTGKKRLPGFSGEWEETSVAANILKSFCGPSPTCEERNIDGSAEWGVLKTTAITWENGWDWKRHKTLPQTFWNQPSIELREGDVLVTKAGPRHRVGVSAWIDFVPDQIIPSGKMIALRPDPDKAVPLMLSAAIAAPDAQTFLDQRTTGMAESQVNYENTVLLGTPIKLPTYAEQAAIASILSDMDAEITTLETKLIKARQVKQGMIQELLTGNIRLIQPGNSDA